MLTESRNPKHREDNYDTWGWFTDADLIWLVQAGCDKPRFEVLVPQDAGTAGGDPNALLQKGDNLVVIRAMGGQSCLAIDPTLFIRGKISAKDFPRLYHVTKWPYLESIYDIGLYPGGLAKDGRRETFFS